MATTKRGGTSRDRSTTAKSRSTPSRSTSTRNSATSRETSGSFLAAVRERPLAAAVLAAGAAGASAFLWARRAQLSEQVNTLSDAISERFSGADANEPRGLDPATEYRAQKLTPPSAGKKGRKASAIDPMMEEQSAVGAISY